VQSEIANCPAQLVERRFPFEDRRLGQTDEPVWIFFLNGGEIVVDETAVLQRRGPAKQARKHRQIDARLSPIIELQIQIV